jgi:CheY-like chemotaxis protein
LTDLVGWKVGVASSTGEGLRQASIYQPDAIILEVSIGEIDELLFLKQLKTQPETQGIPVRLLTLKAKSQMIRFTTELVPQISTCSSDRQSSRTNYACR